MDKQTGIGPAAKKQWIMGACLGSYGVPGTWFCDERAYFRCLCTNPVSFRISQITFPAIQPMDYYRRVQDQYLEARKV